MGNCFGILKKSTAEIPSSNLTPIVKLYGPPEDPATSYIHFALLYKPISLHFIPFETLRFGNETPVIQFESDVVSGSPKTMLRYLDAKFPHPPLTRNSNTNMNCYEEETTPLVVWLVMLQHRSVRWHLERLVRWVEDLVTRRGKGMGDPVMGSPRMEVRKFGRSYSQLLEVMLEHAQMEERVVFPILERADRGLSKAANEEHARDLPIMNGIKEDIKSIGVLDSGSPVYQEALFNLSARLKTLHEHCKEHFEGEERELLPLMEATELSIEQQETVFDECLDVMRGTHSHLLRFFMEGLTPRDAMQYLDLITRCSNKDQVASMFHMIIE